MMIVSGTREERDMTNTVWLMSLVFVVLVLCANVALIFVALRANELGLLLLPCAIGIYTLRQMSRTGHRKP